MVSINKKLWCKYYKMIKYKINYNNFCRIFRHFLINKYRDYLGIPKFNTIFIG